jgi:hypothetical protein
MKFDVLIKIGSYVFCLEIKGKISGFYGILLIRLTVSQKISPKATRNLYVEVEENEEKNVIEEFLESEWLRFH